MHATSLTVKRVIRRPSAPKDRGQASDSGSRHSEQQQMQGVADAEPEEIRKAFESTGEAQVRAQLDDGIISPTVAEVAGRWLAAKQKQRADEQRVLLQRLFYLVGVAASSATVAAIFNILTLFRRH